MSELPPDLPAPLEPLRIVFALTALALGLLIGLI